MGNVPSECHMGDALRCCKCNRVLPPCRSHDDYHQTTLLGRHVFVFNGGEYFRPVGVWAHECSYCFYKPVRDQEQLMREAEERRREEERRRREEERLREEERKRAEESRRKEEEREKQRLREEEWKRTESIWREEERREEERWREEQRRREEERLREEQGRKEEEERWREDARREEERMREEERREEERWREEERRREEERLSEEQRREARWREEERIEEERWREEERRREEEERWREEARREEERVSEEERREEERWREEERRREEERLREEERWREEERREEERWREEERRREEEERWREEARREEERVSEEERREEERWREEERRREEERLREEERWREEERREEERWREEERRREEERWREEARREEERWREEDRREEERWQQEEERRREEERQGREKEAEEKRREEELDQRLDMSRQKAEDQHEKHESGDLPEEHRSKQQVLISHLDDFGEYYEADSGRDEFLEILSSKSSVPVEHLSLSQMTVEQMEKVLSALDKLLFDVWIRDLPSQNTLQHTQVFITELCALSLDTSEELSLESISKNVQLLVGVIGKSAGNVSENFLLTQALYLNLMHFFKEKESCDDDAVLIAKRWAEKEPSAEDLFLIEFLSILTTSLHNTVGRASMYILDMEIRCLELLLQALTRLNERKNSPQITEMLLKLVRTNQWTPAEALSLLNKLSEKYAQDAPIAEVLTLMRIYKISPEWSNDDGLSLLKVLDLAGPENFHVNFRETVKERDVQNTWNTLAELQQSRNLDDSVSGIIRNVIPAVIYYSDSPPENEPFDKDSFKSANMNTDEIQTSLCHLCKAVFDTKGWWPTVQQMMRWCVLLLTETKGAPQLVAVKEDGCVMAMFAATQVFMGHKVDLLLSSDIQTHQQTKEWLDFYSHIGISLSTNTKKADASLQEVYQADIVYGTVDDFVSDYFQLGFEVKGTKSLDLRRGFIMEETSLTALHSMELSKLQENDTLAFAAQILQRLVGSLHSEGMAQRKIFIKVLFEVLLNNINKNADAGSKIVTLSQKLIGKDLPNNVSYFLTTLISLLQVSAEKLDFETNRAFPIGQACLETLLDSAEKFQAAKGKPTKHFQIVSNLVVKQLWSPVDALNLLLELTDHYDEDCVSIVKILHLMETYQVSSQWTDQKNQTLLQLVKSCKTKNLIQLLQNSFGDEKEKSIECLFDEIRQMKNIEEETLQKSHHIVKAIQNLIKTGAIKRFKDVARARQLSHSTNTDDLLEVLAILCNAVHLQIAEKKWFPRATQMIGWCLLVLSDTGKLLEMGTGEGKSCVIAMFAALRALRGEKVDVVSSSSVLCQRDASEWQRFYSHFGLTVDTNTNKIDDEQRKECYQKDVVYGTIEAFAADHLRQVFEMKDVRPNRSYQCIIIDEVDSLLLDQGVQLTYLSTPMASMQHLNIILTMIWGHVSQYGFLSTGQDTLVRCPPASFFKAIFDSIDTVDSEIKDPIDILLLAEKCNIVPEGFTEDFMTSQKDEILQKLKTVSQDAMLNFFQVIEQYIPYGFTVYTLDDNGLLCLQKSSSYNNPDVPDLKFVILEEGLCCPLYDSEEILIEPIAQIISEKIQYTPCQNDKGKISVPGFLKDLIENKILVWVQNAFLAMMLKEGREYVVENNNICPVDFRSTGIVELNKKWGDGLQQFVEIKHQIRLSTISTVTNYISNLAFFEKYQGKIYGTTGTLGNDNEMLFLQDLYGNVSACKMPTFNRRKLFEVKGTLKTTVADWKSEIKRVVMDQISPNSYSGGRAALVICETINKAKEIYEDLKGIIPGEIIIYSRSDRDSLSKIEKELLPGDIIVATNLAGRGTDIKVSKEVNKNGGLFVVLSFLSENTRVERQAFGRTARKGKPGSAQIIMCTAHLQEAFSAVSTLEEAKKTRDRLAADKMNGMMSDISEMKLREDLFDQYCRTLQEIYRDTDGAEERAVVAIMNEFWGIWLQTKSEEIDQLKRDELKTSLEADLLRAKSQCQSQSSPCSSIYHYIKFGNIALDDKKWDVGMQLFEKAMEQDASWAAIAFYNHAYCTIKREGKDYMTNAKEDLKKAQESLKYLSEECMVCQQFIRKPTATPDENNQTSLEKQFITKLNMVNYLDENITKAITKLEEIQGKGRDAIAKKSPMFTLVSDADDDLEAEAYELYNRGLTYVFSVEEKPRTPWEAILVFFLGVLQIVAGALLMVFTCGTLAQVGMGLITEGISDCIYAVEAMVTGEFSWKDWAIDKAISIGVSLIGFGIGKLIAKGFKAAKIAIKRFAKELKALPKFFTKQSKQGFSAVVKTNLKNTLKYTAKKTVEKVVMYGLGKAEEALMEEILKAIKQEIKNGVVDNVKSNIQKDPLGTLVDSIILSHLEDKMQLQGLLKDERRRKKLLATFKGLSSSALQPFENDLKWQEKLNSAISKVLDSVTSTSKAEGKTKAILMAIKGIHLSSLAADAIASVATLSGKYFSNLEGELKKFKKDNNLTEKVQSRDLSAQDTQMLLEFKQDLALSIGTSLADTMVNVFHKKFSKHLVSEVQNKVNNVIKKHARIHLKSQKTEDILKAGQNSRYITYMPVDLSSEKRGKSRSTVHAKKIQNPGTPGTLLDARVLSETTGTKVVILTEDRHGKLTKMHEVNPGTKQSGQTVTLVYRPKSDQYPRGHYDAFINNKVVSVSSGNKSGLFHALARGMKPDASDQEVALEAARLRSVEAQTLLKHPHQWEPFIKRKMWTDSIKGGDWYMAEAGPQKRTVGEVKARLEAGTSIQVYKAQEDRNKVFAEGVVIHRQLPVKTILHAKKLNQNSRLAEVMLEVTMGLAPRIPGVQSRHGRQFLSVYVPNKIPNGGISSETSASIKKNLAQAISRDDVLSTVKLVIVNEAERLKLNPAQSNSNLVKVPWSRTRRALFESSLEKYSSGLVKHWFPLLRQKGVMSDDDYSKLTSWINARRYLSHEDPHWQRVSTQL